VFFLHHRPKETSESFRSLTQVVCPTSHHLTLRKGKTNKKNKTSTLGVIKQTFATSSSSSFLCNHFLNEKFIGRQRILEPHLSIVEHEPDT
jgi:hypothetical protein